jgi:protein O-mannosyl-transferase
VLAGILSYSNSLSGPPLFDDHAALLDNQHIRTLQPSSVLFPERENPLAGRPLVNLSFAVNYAIGGLDVRGYHVWNLAVHLLCGLIAFGLVRRTLDQPRIAEGVRR